MEKCGKHLPMALLRDIFGYICSWMGLRRGSDQIVAEKSVITQPGYDCYIAMGFRWPIEIDGLPNLNMGGFSMAMLNN